MVLARLLVVALLCAFGVSASHARRSGPLHEPPAIAIAVAQLPPEARTTLALIRRGGPFPYEKDGAPFANRESRLPGRARGYYREYTVPTPGARDRGARRIIAGGSPRDSYEYWYTDDHYQTFYRIRE